MIGILRRLANAACRNPSIMSAQPEAVLFVGPEPPWLYTDPTSYLVMSAALVFARSTCWSCAIFSSLVIMARRSPACVTHAGVGKTRPPPVPAVPSPPAVLPVPGIHLMPAAPSGVGPLLPPLEHAVETNVS